MVQPWVHCSRSYIRVPEGRNVIWLTWFLEMGNINVNCVVWLDDASWKKPGSRSGAYQLVDCVVLAAMDLLEVEFPHGHAGVDVAVVEDAVNRDVLPRSHHHFLRNVAHGCGWNKRRRLWDKRVTHSHSEKCSLFLVVVVFVFFDNKKKTLSRIFENFLSVICPQVGWAWGLTASSLSAYTKRSVWSQLVCQQRGKDVWLLCKTGEHLNKRQIINPSKKLPGDSTVLWLWENHLRWT